MSELKDKLEKYLRTVKFMSYKKNSDIEYADAVKITNDVLNEFPHITRLKLWEEILVMYPEYKTHRDKENTIKDFVRTASLDLDMIIRDIE